MFGSIRGRRPRHSLWLTVALAGVLLAAGCGGGAGAGLFAPPTPTFTPTATPTPSPTPVPVEAAAAGVATPVPTPQVTIPQGFTGVADKRLGYSFAVPRGWSELDLRGSQVQTLAGMFGMGDQIAALNRFLDSPEGQMLGEIYVTDLTSAMFGGLPTLLAVVVADAPGYTAEDAKQLVEQLLASNASVLGNVRIDNLQATTVNNLPAVQGTATADLAQVGMNAAAFAKVVALLANDQVYLMVLLAQENQRTAKEPVFDQIIGTFRPE